tara:strand:- start:153 stop:716 length:564 start_codon:yes stop_codon:yes gene_type:complete
LVINTNQNPALVLNADYRPLSYFPLSIWPWQTSIKAAFMDRVNIIAEYDSEVRSASFSMKIPSVISLKKYIPSTRRVAFTRYNLFLRDQFSCQYCGNNFLASDLTFDHVIPRSKGGETNWKNVVSACTECNHSKGSKTCKNASMTPIKQPIEPTNQDLQKIGQKFPPNYLHVSWNDFLYWDTELEQN